MLLMTLLNNSIENIRNIFCRRTISLFLFAGISTGMFMSMTTPAHAQEQVPETSEAMPISLEDEAAAQVSAESHDTSTPYIFAKPVKVNAHKRYSQKQYDALLKRVKPYYNQMKNDREKDSFDKEFIKFYEKAKKEKVTDENGRLLENYIHAYDLGAPYTKEDIQNDINEARSYQRHSLFVSFFNNKEHKELQNVVESVNREMTKERMNRNDREEKHRAITQQLEKTKKADEKVTNKMKYVAPSVFAVGAVLAVTVYLCRKRRLGLGKKVLLGVMLGGTLVGFLCTDIRADQHGTLAWNSDYTQYQATNEYDWTSEGLPGVMTYETFNMTQESIADNGDITYGIWMGYWANVNNFKSWKKPVNVKIGDTNIVIQPTGKPFNKDIQWMKGKSITLKAGQTYSIDVSIYNVVESGFYKGTITVPKKIESDMVYHGNGGTYDNGKKEFRETVKNGTAYKTRENFFTRPGYKFKGWTEIRQDGSKVDWTSYINKNWTWTYLYDAHLYAQWKPNNYTYNIKYVSSSGKDLGHDTVTGAFDTSKTITPPAKTGYTTPAAQTVKFDSTSAKTITFTYPLINYSISYDVNGGNALSSPRTSYNVESSAYTLPVTSRTGYTFTGWTGSNGTTPQKSVTIAAGSTGNKSYKANWSVNSYTNSISHWAGGFKNKEGNNSSKTWFALKTTTFSKNYGETFSMNDSLATAIPNGFYLMGRFGTSSLEGTWKTYEKPYSITQPAKELNFEYDYYPYDYSITYNLDGGTNNSANPSKYNVLYGVSLRNPTKTGYKFLGWYEGNKKVTGINEGADATFSSSNDLYTKLSTRKTGNVTLTAKWKANSLTIHYHSNGAFGGNKYENGSWQNNVILDYEQSKDTIVLTERNEEGTFNSGLQTHGLYDYSWKRKNDIYMYKNGYIGTGKYNTNPNGSGVEIDEDKTFNSVIELANYLGASIDSKDSSIDLYPQWKAISYSIVYNGNGATSGSMSEQTATFDRNVELVSNSFSRKYTVTYNAMGGTVNAPNNVASATFNGWEDRGNITFMDNNYTYNNFDAPYYSQNYTDLNAAYGFNKYNLIKHYFLYGKSEGRNPKDKAGNAGLYPNKATVKNLTITNGYKVNLYANWKLGSVTLPTPTRFGYKFLGWYTSAEGGTKISGTTYTPTSNVTLYAQWKLDSYYIDYKVNDAGLTDRITDNLPDNNGSLPGKDTAAMLTDFALQNGSKYNTKYTFKEWNTKPDGSGKKFTTSITNDGSLCKPGETLTIYAIWDTTPIMSAKDFYLIEEVPAPNDVVYSGVGFDKTPTEKYPDKLSEVAYPIKGYTKNGTDISSRIKVEYVEFDGSKTAVSSIDTNKPGKYTVHYSLTDGKQTKKFTRTVTVLPISAPAINAGDRYFKVNTLITADMLKETVSVNDKYDGDLIDKVIIENIDNIKSDKDGVYQITYKVTNRANKTTTKTVNIFIIDYLPDNRADEANKFRFVRKDCSEANDYCLQYFNNDSKWTNDETLRELLMNSLSKSENETAIKKFKLSSKNSSSKTKN